MTAATQAQLGGCSTSRTSRHMLAMCWMRSSQRPSRWVAAKEKTNGRVYRVGVVRDYRDFDVRFRDDRWVSHWEETVKCRHGRTERHAATDYTRSGTLLYSCPGGDWYAKQGKEPPTRTWPDGSIREGKAE